MPVTKTIDFLPAVFQTEVNKKFLNATLDQLIAEPKLNRISGYIGRRFTSSFVPGDSYIRESTADRRNYQLEPALVVKDVDSGDVNFHVTYPEILQKLRYYSATTSNQQKFWKHEYYTYNPHTDLDKFINFNQYYWLPSGPDAIDVFSGVVDSEKTFEITTNTADNAFNISGYYETPNPDIVLARGGEYKFNINQPGRKFWIQSAPGLSGKQTILSNISSREVLGVTNNGTDNGVVTFVVPDATAQDFYITMPKLRDVDLATELRYTDIHGILLSVIVEQFGGIDGQTTPSSLDGKYLIFNRTWYDDIDWTGRGIFDLFPFDDNLKTYDYGLTVPETQRYGVWKIALTPVDNDYTMILQYVEPIPMNNKVTVKSGVNYGGLDWYKNADGFMQSMPVITANLDTLYYQDAEDSSLVGVIRLVDSTGSVIDVEQELLGKTGYVSPNGVVFSNGMKIRFDTSVTPATYKNNEYYVEGVGESITLTLASSLGDAVDTPDYVVINRSSLDKSPWSCNNRWFHKEVIRATSFYNNTVPVYDQMTQAKRPIIEFEANLQLYDYGTTAKAPVDIYDNVTTTPFTTYEGMRVNSPLTSGVYIDGVEVTPGMRVIFGNDNDPVTRNNVWVTSFIRLDSDPRSPYQLHFTLADDGEVVDGDTVLVKSGLVNKNKNFWFYNNSWNIGQVKDRLNQSPLFDVYDDAGVSFGDTTKYPRTTTGGFFTGTKIFSYATSDAGVNDLVLGFPLKYRTVDNVGDIVFDNNFDSDEFQYNIDRVNYTVKINTGFLKKYNASGEYTFLNNWSTVNQETPQFQLITYLYNGSFNSFFSDIVPNPETKSVTLKVYANGKQIPRNRFIVQNVTNGIKIIVDQSLIKADDKIDILINSDQVSTIGHFQIPVGLNSNAQNQTITEMTLGELRNHVQEITSSASAFKGTLPGISNLRDLNLKNFAGTMLQHSGSIPNAALFLTDENANFNSAIIYASQEYSRFKNRFLEALVTRADLVDMNPVQAVDEIMTQLNAVKTKLFPWYYSDMVPYGVKKNVIDHTVFNPAVRSYEITQIFNDKAPSAAAVLVYLNGTQLVKGSEYEFDVDSPALIIDDSVNLTSGDIITVVEYSDTAGCYVPETPTKLGLYPKTAPVIYLDSTYKTPVTMIRGHDGSLIPAYGDFRDQIILELEKRIYNNIKSSYDESQYSIYSVIPGKFRTTGVSNADFNSVVGRWFMRWVGLNRLDYTENNTWVNTDGFTWNYSGLKNSFDGEPLPGSWRACYQYFYDTQTPHLTPWEMLGFSEKPTWWEAQYGPAPYTGGNMVMWTDLENGYIAQGPRQGYDSRFKRPGLTKVIPVNASGELMPPNGSIATKYVLDNTDKSWAVGNVGPVENAWQKSSDYPFAVQAAMAALTPSKYFGLCVAKSTVEYNHVVGQFLNSATKQRLVQTDIKINGSVDDANNTVYAAGCVNWISDYLRHFGITPDTYLGSYLKNLSTRLSYRMAGFSDKKYLKVLAAQHSPNSTNDSVLIPDSDYDLILNKSTPLQKIVYSAVVIEKTVNGFRVSGYNVDDPVFVIIPPDTASESFTTTVLGMSVDIYKQYRKVKLSVPYGFEFATIQQVANFLMGYGLFLASQGFKFDEYDPDLQEIRNWQLSVKEFLFWYQQGWREQSILVLSPFANKIKVSNNTAIVDKIGNSVIGSRVLNQNFQAIGHQSLVVTRDRNMFNCTVTNQDMIGLVELNLVQYEHAMIFNNVTMFNDTIYRPELGMRQSRLKLVGFKTSDWTGNLDPRGFVYNSSKIDAWQPMKDYLKGDLVQHKGIEYTALTDLPGSAEFNFNNWARSTGQNKTGLLPNLAFNSGISESFYDVDSVNLESSYDQFGKSLIGFKNRSYLDMLGVDDITQVKFYQGYIKEKGVLNSFNALAQVSFNNTKSNIELSEEWAMRVGEYGALDIAQTVDLELSDQQILSNPFTVQISGTDNGADFTIGTPYLSSDINFAAPIFLNRDNNLPRLNDIKTAGFVNVDDVDLTIFDIANYKTLNGSINDIGTGTKIWCAKDFDYNWNVFRVSETNVLGTSISNALDGLIKITTSAPHRLVKGDIVLIKNAKEFNGFYEISGTMGINSFIVDTGKDLTGFVGYTDMSVAIFTLMSLRFDYAYQISETSPIGGWVDTDIAWVENNSGTNWGVYKKESPWTFNRMLATSSIANNTRLGTSVNLSYDNNFALVGKPGVNTAGQLVIYAKDQTNRLVEQASVSSPVQNTVGFGSSLDQGMQVAVVGAPASVSDRGYAFVVTRTTMGESSVTQVLAAGDGVAGDKFGYSVTISQDDQWICIGAPGADSAYIYGYVADVRKTSMSFNADGTTQNFVLNFMPESIDLLSVSSNNKQYAPYVDYTISGAIIQFVTPPPSNDGMIVARQGPGFTLVSKVTGTANTLFGHSVSTATDGAQFAIGAPLEDVSGKESAGAAYVYDRTIETFTATGGSVFTTVRPILKSSKVKVNGELKIRRTEYTTMWDYEINSNGQVQFVQAPIERSAVQIETNAVNLLEKKVAATPNTGAQLGYCVNLCPTNCSLYVGAPYHTDDVVNAGAVYRLFNQGRTLGHIAGTVMNPTVTVGSSIRINDYEVTFTDSTIDGVVADINKKSIPGVVASNQSGYLRIDSDVQISRNRLRILSGIGPAITELGLEVFPEVQFISSPYNNPGELFGKKIRVTRTLPDTTLLIGSSVASTYENVSFDETNTRFDHRSTTYRDRVEYSGAVYVYTYLNDARETIKFPAGKLAFAQQLAPNNATISWGDQYGYDFDIQDNVILVGAPNENSTLPGAGKVYEFRNPNRYLGWRLLREETAKVDIDSINKFYLWSKKSNSILTTLDYIDPAKGKILGNAEQEITYKTTYDPATYNSGSASNVVVDALRHWSDKQVGQVWWDLDAVRYVDYEQGELAYRATNWGKMFPGSSIDVYEWVESLYLPSQYVANGGNGVPKNADDSAYVSVSVYDSLSNQEYKKYYYWVKDKTTVEPNQFGRTTPVSSVKHLIENPRGQNIKFVAAIQNDCVAVFNCGSQVVGTDTVLHIDYDRELNSSVIHSEWELVGENAQSGLSNLPEKIINKIVDSLAGIDKFGNAVPDPTLPVQKRYGIGLRPRQSVFINREQAIKVLVDNVNAWFETIPLSLTFDIAQLASQEPVPPANSGVWDMSVANVEELRFINPIIQPEGYLVLVESDSTVSNLWTIYKKNATNTWDLVRVQSYNDEPYWDYADWYAAGFDSSIVPKFTVDTSADLAKLQLHNGDIVKIRNDGTGNFKIIQVFQTNTEIIALQNGTVKFNENLYALPKYGMGFGNDNFDNSRFDQNPSIELRTMVTTLVKNVLTGQFSDQYGKLMQVLFGYILTEQKYVDWAFKTSFISVLHKIRKLTQPVNYVKDNQDLYTDYLEEIKPYRTTIREYITDYEGVDNVNGYVTDFDVPAYYDDVKQMYRSPSGEYYQDITAVNRDPVYHDWLQNYTYSIPAGIAEPGSGAAGIYLIRSGKGYLEKPVVTVTGSATGVNAVAEAVFDYGAGQITAINVIKPGVGYIGKDSNKNALPPKVTITGGSLPDQAVMYQRGLTVSVGQIIKTPDLRYFSANQAGVLGYLPAYNAEQEPGDVVNVGIQLSYIGEEAIAYVRLENSTIRKISTRLLFDRIAYTSDVRVWEPYTTYNVDDIVSYNSVAYRVVAGFTSGATFSGNNLYEYDFEKFMWAGNTSHANANDRIQAYYSPATGTPGKALDLLQAGIAYSGVKVSAPRFSDNPFFDSGAAFDSIGFDSFEIGPDGTIELNRSLLDTIITSQYTDNFLTPTTDTRPEGIVVDGGGGDIPMYAEVPPGFKVGGFVTSDTSHAPEELIPGRIFDTLDIQVYQTASPSIITTPDVVGFDIQLSSYTVKASFETYQYGNGREYHHNLFVFTSLSGRLANTDYTINYFDSTITMLKPLAAGDIVYIYAFNNVGTGEVTELNYVGDSANKVFETHVSNGIPLVALVIVDGVRQTAFSIVDGYRGQNIVFDSPPPTGSFVYFLVCKSTPTAKISEAYTQYHTVTNPGTPLSNYSFSTERTIGDVGPKESYVSVEINKQRLRPPTNAYYVADGRSNFGISDTDIMVSTASLVSSDVRVYVDGQLKVAGADYTFAGSSVTFVTPPEIGSQVIVSVFKFVNYRVSDSVITISNTELEIGDSITVDSFSVHDELGIKTTVYAGGQTYTSQTPAGLDELGFDDIGGFDGLVDKTVVISKFDLGTTIENINYVWVSLDGKQLIPNYDFVVNGQFLLVSDKFTVTDSSILAVTVFGNNPVIPPMSFRQFRDITGKTEYLRIAKSGVTALARDLTVGDTEVVVVDASSFPEPSVELAIPGTIMIDGERIYYYQIDREANTLRQITRGVAGTGAKYHQAGTRVDDASAQQLIPNGSDSYQIALFKDSHAGDGSRVTFVADLATVGFDMEIARADAVQVYVGGSQLGQTDFTVDSLSPLTITLPQAPAAGVWVAFEVRTSQVWYEPNIVPENPSASALANSETVQANFIKATAGILP